MFDMFIRPPTPSIEETEREFTPMTISPRESIEASLGVPAQMFDTYELLLSIGGIHNTLQLDSDGEVLDPNAMQEDLA